jgi:radical SAM superfamily enzyme YgiQ (UPF0313 family)
MRVLLVNPEYPDTYWGLRHMMPLVRRHWVVPPLGLLTVAALLPREWELRLVDLNVEPLRDDDLSWADVVMLTGMLVQSASLHAVLERCQRRGVRTVVGGPYATAMPEALGDADHLVLGEAEEIVPELAADLAAGRACRVYREERKPDIGSSPVPLYHLLRPGSYHYLAVQYSRGCPFQCEFCDITTLYGRVPRTKSPGQVIVELEAIRATGFGGRVMFVDDNFIGPRKEVRRLLSELAVWRKRTRARLEYFTEASIDLADDPQLVDLMTEAGFAVVFIGIETPNQDSLRESRKTQNLRRDMLEQVRDLRRRGLDVYAGFILGFDHDGPDIFDLMIRFVQDAGIPYAMVGMLDALPGTPLYHRLVREGRLRPDVASGDNFAPTNVVTRLPAEVLLEGYARVLETLYDPEVYFARCREHLREWRMPETPAVPTSFEDFLVLWRSLWTQGVKAPYRSAYWRFLLWTLRRHPSKLPWAVAQACAGHHFITYTRETAVPRLRSSRATAAAPQRLVA